MHAIEWTKEGTLLACRNTNTPSVLYIYAFLDLERTDSTPHLLSVVLFNAPIAATSWKPSATPTLGIVTGQSSVYTWTLSADAEPRMQSVEAIAIPNGACRRAGTD